jgi:hypothetical protein
LKRFEFDVTPAAPIKKSAQFVKTYSVDGDFTHGFARGEWQGATSGKGVDKSLYENWYVQGGVRLTEKFTILSEYSTARTLLHFPVPLPDVMFKINNDIGGALNYSPSANVRYKFELHRADGYNFDTPVPSLIPPTKPPFVMSLAPRSKAVYGILSISVSF